jgi:glutamate dehydrogenase
VEGANIFITPEARKKLHEEAGVMIVKDSSANKCGVICSSFEISSSMLLSQVGFFAAIQDAQLLYAAPTHRVCVNSGH